MAQVRYDDEDPADMERAINEIAGSFATAMNIRIEECNALNKERDDLINRLGDSDVAAEDFRAERDELQNRVNILEEEKNELQNQIGILKDENSELYSRIGSNV